MEEIYWVNPTKENRESEKVRRNLTTVKKRYRRTVG